MVRARQFGAIAGAMMLACARAEPPPDPPAEVLEELLQGPPMVSDTVLTMRHVRFEEGAMELDIVDAPHDTVAWDVGGVLLQTVPLGETGGLRITVRAGEGESLASFRRDYEGGSIAPLPATRTCGTRARRLIVREPEQFIECIEYADGRPSEPGYIYAETTIAHSFPHGPLRVVATWGIPTDLRNQYRDQERHFFASLHCP